jgi:phosphoglycolate phosphatase-like HAD superfamily hydrolase
MYAVIWDLDGVLADNNHAMNGKESYHDLTNEEWTVFYDTLPLCRPIERWVNLFHSLAAVGVANIIITNRPHDQRSMTYEWLDAHGIHPSALLTRTPGDGHGGSKKKRTSQFLDRSGYTVLMAIDDDPAAIRDYEALGFQTMYVHTGYHARAPQ